MPAIRPSLLKAIQSDRHIQGYTHGFYRYPAASSPELVRAVIFRYSDPDEWVLDPFMGGGTSVVEAIAHGRRAVGLDANALAVFVARAKTTPVTRTDQADIGNWVRNKPLDGEDVGGVADPRATGLPAKLRRPLASAIATLPDLANGRQRRFAKCALLRTGQWALETQDTTPTLASLQRKLCEVVDGMIGGLEEWIAAVREAGATRADLPGRRLLFRIRAEDTDLHSGLSQLAGRIGLVVTSPPYPGVHVLYHRWQVRSRRETAAPYWIVDRRDGFTPSYYTMGGRTAIGLERYFNRVTKSFAAIRPLLRDDALIVQLVGFSRPDEQLRRYLSAMREAGYRSAKPPGYRRTDLVRQVPNRRWYAREKDLGGSKEYLLFHSPR